MAMISIDALRNGVDLFRGEVAFRLPLATLPGAGGPDFEINLDYRSDVADTISTWNMVAPTGVVGLGWSLPPNRIVAEYGPGGGLDSGVFYLEWDGGREQLIQTDSADGVLSYSTASYRFWKIRHFQSNQRWDLKKEDGTTYVYGEADSNRGTVDWGVAWGNWVGASSQTQGQTPVATAWSLSRIQDMWKRTVTFHYTQVTENVGDGLPYTQATYLQKITGAAGDSAMFTYAEKATFEYEDPHSEPKSRHSWQEQYQTHYLTSIAVQAPSGSLLYTVGLDYSGLNGQTQYIGSGAMAKRLLMGITLAYPGVAPLPGFAFTYVTDTLSDARGALNTVTTPEGGVVTYDYASATQIAFSKRDYTVTRPSKEGVTYSKPRFWFADKYTVVSWLGSDNSATVSAYTWEGRWIEASLLPFQLSDSTSYEGLVVTTARNAFGVMVQGKLALYFRDAKVTGGWLGTGELLEPALDGKEPIKVTSADTLVAVLGLRSGKLNLFSWNGLEWVPEPLVQLVGGAEMRCSVSARENVLCAASTYGGSEDETLHLLLMYQDGAGQWQVEPSTWNKPIATVNGLEVETGPGFAVVTTYGPSGASGSETKYSYDAYVWITDHASLQQSHLTDVTTPSGTAATLPVVRGSFVGIGSKLFRYDGALWNMQDSATITYPNQEHVALSRGVDQVLRTIIKTDNSLVFDLLAYYPVANASSEYWTVPAGMSQVVASAGSLAARAARTSEEASRYVIFPVQNDGTLNNGVYYQQPSGEWQNVLQLAGLSASDLPSLQLLGENYCIHQNGSDTVIYPLANGDAGDAGSGKITLKDQQVLVPNGDGAELLGEVAFATYSGTWNSTDLTLTLHRVVGEAVQGEQTHAPVAKVTMGTGYKGLTTTNTALELPEPEAIGFSDLITAYAFDAKSATVERNGRRAAYNQAIKAEGTTDTAPATNGSTATWFFNGLTAAETPARAYPTGSTTNAAGFVPLLSGLAYRRAERAATADGAAEVRATTWYWWVFAQALSVQLGDERLGFYARTQQTDTILDGVTTTVDTLYSRGSEPPVTGLPVEVRTYQFNGLGQKETLKEQYTYFWEKYDLTRSLNLLSPVVETRSSTDDVTTAITITTWRHAWGMLRGRWAPSATYNAIQQDPQPFNKWTANNQVLAAGWRLTTMTDSRTAAGQPANVTDAIGRSQAVLYDAAGRYQVANFFNASLLQGEVGYYGFEPYEEDFTWVYVGGKMPQHIDSTQAHTGTRCLKIDPVSGSQSGPKATFLSTSGSRKYLFSCWMQTPKGFASVAGHARWTLTVQTVAASPQPVGDPIVLDFPDTSGKWQYIHTVIDLEALRKATPLVPPGTQLRVTILGYNQKTGASCWVDELRFSPLDCRYAAIVYDPVLWQPMAVLGENGTTFRIVRDPYLREIALIGPDENVVGLDVPTLARSLSSDGSFDPNLPNSLLQITCSSDGLYYDFDPSDKSDWTLPTGWDVKDRQLEFSGTATGPLGSQAVLTNFQNKNYAARVRVQPPVGVTNLQRDVSIGTGDVYAHWDATASNWTLAVYASDNTATTQITRAGAFGQDWCFAVVDELVLFYVDGREIFAYSLAEGVRKDGKLKLGLTGPGTFSGLVVCIDPGMTMSFLDGAGKAMQQLALVDGHTVVASGTLFDASQRPKYEKNPIFIGPSIGASTLTNGSEQYRAIGNIGTYLPDKDGKQLTLEQYLAPANDYPFTAVRYETNPLSRVLEVGIQGADYTVGSGHTQRISYGHNTEDDPLTDLLPEDAPGRGAGSYYLVTVTAPNGGLSYQLVNQGGQLIAETQMIDEQEEGAVERVWSGVYRTIWNIYYQGGPAVSRIEQPNYRKPPPSSSKDFWLITRSHNFEGQRISETTPDTGETKFAYDSVGRMRFVLDAEGAMQASKYPPQPQRIKYFKYDGLNRVVEDGIIQKAGVSWDGIQQYADLMNWPDTSVAPEWYRRYQYDLPDSALLKGENAANEVNRLGMVLINNNGGGDPDREAYEYNPRGLVRTIRTRVASYDGQTYVSSYCYNNDKQLTQVTFPRPLASDGTPIGDPFKVSYSYDRRKLLAAVGHPSVGNEVADPENPLPIAAIYYASYGYGAKEEPKTAHLNNGNGRQMVRKFCYNKRGWLAELSGDFYSEVLTYPDYFVPGANKTTAPPKSASSIYRPVAGNDNWTAPQVRESGWKYKYDHANQLTAAVSDQREINMVAGIGGAEARILYDHNGNLTLVPRGPAREDYDYLTGTGPDRKWRNNRVQRVTSTISARIQFKEGETYPGWQEAASNAGPCNATRVAPASNIPNETLPAGQALQLGGGSLGHYNYLEYRGYLSPTGTYTLTYWLKTPDPFATQEGPACWSLRLYTASGGIVNVQVHDLGKGTTIWKQFTVPSIDMGSIVDSMGLDEEVIAAALVLINGRVSGGSASGAALQVADIQLSGTTTKSEYGYGRANGEIMSASGRHISDMKYHALTGVLTDVTLAGAEAKTVKLINGLEFRRMAEVCTYPDGANDKTLYLYRPDGRSIARKVTQGGTERTIYFIYGPDGLLATVPKEDVGAVQYVLKDRMHSIRAIVDKDARLVALYDYSPFGELIAGPEGEAPPYRYRQHLEERVTGTYSYMARSYDSALRRYFAPEYDRVLQRYFAPEQETENVRNLLRNPTSKYWGSPYVYESNNPLYSSDYFTGGLQGYSWSEVIQGVLALSVGLGGLVAFKYFVTRELNDPPPMPPIPVPVPVPIPVVFGRQAG